MQWHSCTAVVGSPSLEVFKEQGETALSGQSGDGLVDGRHDLSGLFHFNDSVIL